ncbi:MAG TPA: hypothetical protein VJN43_15635 [Bryobacteraceae bacterium]|nr:hypothetical protein [Bryobacteraceae bacterium]
MSDTEPFFALRDVESGEATQASPSSVAWNRYRKKWILLAERIGSVYKAEADQPIGSWGGAVKIVGHDGYNFHNVVQHSFFDQQIVY